MPETILVNGRGFEKVELLGHGKGGYSYLARDSYMEEWNFENWGINTGPEPRNFSPA